MPRFTTNDKRWGPFVWGRVPNEAFSLAIHFNTGENDEDQGYYRQNYLWLEFMNWLVIWYTPTWFKPYRIKVTPNWDPATVKTIGRSFYYDHYNRCYGFGLHGGFLELFYGRAQIKNLKAQRRSTWLPGYKPLPKV